MSAFYHVKIFLDLLEGVMAAPEDQQAKIAKEVCDDLMNYVQREKSYMTILFSLAPELQPDLVEQPSRIPAGVVQSPRERIAALYPDLEAGTYRSKPYVRPHIPGFHETTLHHQLHWLGKLPEALLHAHDKILSSCAEMDFYDDPLTGLENAIQLFEAVSGRTRYSIGTCGGRVEPFDRQIFFLLRQEFANQCNLHKKLVIDKIGPNADVGAQAMKKACASLIECIVEFDRQACAYQIEASKAKESADRE